MYETKKRRNRSKTAQELARAAAEGTAKEAAK